MLGVDHLDKKNGLLFIPSQICEVVAEGVFLVVGGNSEQFVYHIKEAMKKKGICCVTHKTFRKII